MAPCRLTLLIAGLVVALCPPAAAGLRELTRVAEGEFPNAQLCQHCHVAIHEEWAGSPHARAFTSTTYRAATDDYRFADCLPCHAPQPTLTASTPAARDLRREEGVTCVACHLEDGRQWGPLEPTGLLDPHPIGVAPLRYRDSRFCGRCHEGTFAQWQQAAIEGKPTCQECHMPSVRRKMTQATGLFSKPIVALEERGDLRRHTFVRVPRETPFPPVTFAAQRLSTGVALAVTNHLPHTLPTGDFGTQIVRLDVLTAGPDAAPALVAQRELVRQSGTALASGQTLRWDIAWPRGMRALRVRVVRIDGAAAEEIATAEMAVP